MMAVMVQSIQLSYLQPSTSLNALGQRQGQEAVGRAAEVGTGTVSQGRLRVAFRVLSTVSPSGPRWGYPETEPPPVTIKRTGAVPAKPCLRP